jgi:hypothetical protein
MKTPEELTVLDVVSAFLLLPFVLLYAFVDAIFFTTYYIADNDPAPTRGLRPFWSFFFSS